MDYLNVRTLPKCQAAKTYQLLTPPLFPFNLYSLLEVVAQVIGDRKPFEQRFSVLDATISFPKAEHEKVSAFMLYVYCFGVPALSVLIVTLAFGPGNFKRRLLLLNWTLLGVGKHTSLEPQPQDHAHCETILITWFMDEQERPLYTRKYLLNSSKLSSVVPAQISCQDVR